MKKILITIVAILGFFSFPTIAQASSATVKATTSSSRINLGSYTTVTVTVSGSAAIGSWQYNLNYDSSKLTLTSSTNSTYIVDYGDGSQKIARYTYTFKGKAVGTAYVSISNAAVIDYDTVNEMSVTTSGCSIVVANYSSNNDLSALTVKDGTLSPAFSASVTKYNVTMPNTIDTVTIDATAKDSKSKVTGDGEFDVVEGENSFSINVVAENGSVKTYIVNIDVEELNPITTTIEEKEYTVIRNAGKVETPAGYTETTIFIGEEEIAAFNSEVTNLYLVVLKDSEGAFQLASYNVEKETYALYNQVTVNTIILYVMNTEKDLDIPAGYKETTVTINDIEYQGWKLEDNKEKGFYLIYGMNVETGDVGFYKYDNVEGTLQRFINEPLLEKETELKELLMLMYITSGIGILLLGLNIFLITRLKISTKRMKKISKHNKKDKE